MVYLVGVDNDGFNVSVKLNYVFIMCGKMFDKVMVKKESVWNVMFDFKVEINNDKDNKFKYVYILYMKYLLNLMCKI